MEEQMQGKTLRRKKKHHINWHQAVCETLKIELEEYLEYLEFHEEYHLGKSKESLRVDVLIIQKTSSLHITKQIAEIFQTYNLIEYKSPRDNLSIDDYYKLIGYACIFRANTGKVNEVSNEEVTLTFIVSKFPKKLEKELKKRKIALVKRGKGIYDISEEIFRTQIIINRELDEKENLWLRCLDNELKEQRLYQSLEKEYKKHKNESRYSVPMNAILRSNYGKKGEKNTMCEALYELFEDELIEREDKGIARGKAEGVLELLEDVGKYSSKLEKCVMEERDIATLRKWLKLAARAESIEEFEEKSGIVLS